MRQKTFGDATWYTTGDRGFRDADGYFWFVGRADDVISSAGYRIGPFEVESTLKKHPAVLESGSFNRLLYFSRRSVDPVDLVSSSRVNELN